MLTYSSACCAIFHACGVGTSPGRARAGLLSWDHQLLGSFLLEESAKNSMQALINISLWISVSLGPDEEGENEAAADKDGAGMKSTVVRALQG